MRHGFESRPSHPHRYHTWECRGEDTSASATATAVSVSTQLSRGPGVGAGPELNPMFHLSGGDEKPTANLSRAFTQSPVRRFTIGIVYGRGEETEAIKIVFYVKSVRILAR